MNRIPLSAFGKSSQKHAIKLISKYVSRRRIFFSADKAKAIYGTLLHFPANVLAFAVTKPRIPLKHVNLHKSR